MDIEGQKKSHGKRAVTTGKDKNGNESHNHLKKEMMKNKIKMFLVGGLKEFKKRQKIIFFQSGLGQMAFFNVGIEIEPIDKVVNIKKERTQ